MLMAACGPTNKRGVASGCECAAGGARCYSKPELWERKDPGALQAWGGEPRGTEGTKRCTLVVIEYSTTSRILIEYLVEYLVEYFTH